MAKRLKGTSETESAPEGGAVLNSTARAEAIRRACREITALEADRKAIGQDIAKVKQQIVKGDLGMKLADFNAVLRLYDLENDARDEFFDTLKECFQALGVGEQLGFLDALAVQ